MRWKMPSSSASLLKPAIGTQATRSLPERPDTYRAGRGGGDEERGGACVRRGVRDQDEATCRDLVPPRHRAVALDEDGFDVLRRIELDQLELGPRCGDCDERNIDVAGG